MNASSGAILPAASRRLATLGGALLVLATALFVWGAFAERSGHHEVTHREPTSTDTPAPVVTPSHSAAEGPGEGEAGHDESAEPTPTGSKPASVTGPSTLHNGESASERQAETATEPAQESGSEAGEYRPLGLNFEQPWLIVTAALVSLAVAAVLIGLPRSATFVPAGVLGLGFAVIEIPEVIHQRHVHRSGLLALAAGALLAHTATAVVSGRTMIGRRLGDAPTDPRSSAGFSKQ